MEPLLKADGNPTVHAKFTMHTRVIIAIVTQYFIDPQKEIIFSQQGRCLTRGPEQRPEAAFLPHWDPSYSFQQMSPLLL